MEPSYVNIENLVFGRMAFRGMNPEIERLMELERNRAEEAAAAAAEKDVGDQEMAEVALANTVARKFAPKRNRDGASAMAAQQAGTSGEDRGPELLIQGAQMMEDMRSQNRVWRNDQQQLQQRGRGRGGARGRGDPRAKKRRFMKPMDE